MARTKSTTTREKDVQYANQTPGQKYRQRQRVREDVEQRRELMRRRDIHTERGIRLPDFANTTIPGTIARFGWEKFCSTPPEYDEALVREFYAHLHHGIFNDFGEVNMGSFRISITPDLIREFYHLPQLTEENRAGMVGGIPPIPGVDERDERSGIIAGALRQNGDTYWTTKQQLRKTQLRQDTAFWMLFLKSNIRPGTHTTEVDPVVARMLFCIQNGMPMDVPEIIRFEMLHAATDDASRVLPFPCLITYFCKNAGMASRLPKQPKSDFVRKTYNLHVTYSQKSTVRMEHLPEAVENADELEAESSDDDPDFDPTDHMGSSTQRQAGPSNHATPPWATRLEQTMDRILTELAQIRERLLDTTTQPEGSAAASDHVRPGSQRRPAAKRRHTAGSSSHH